MPWRPGARELLTALRQQGVPCAIATTSSHETAALVAGAAPDGAISVVVGAEDRQRLDQYFSGLRDLERQLDKQLEKPEPRPACVRPPAPPQDPPAGLDVELVATRHKLMTDLLVMAVACDQTRVFNMLFSDTASNRGTSLAPRAASPAPRPPEAPVPGPVR